MYVAKDILCDIREYRKQVLFLVYVYPSHHYAYWAKELPDAELPWGSFGENFTAEGLAEDAVCIGDEFQIGGIRVVVTEPRMPCIKLAIRFGRADMLKRFLKSQRTGFYLGVVEEGQVRVGDAWERVSEDPAGLTVADVTSLYTTEKSTRDLLHRAISVAALPASWREYFEHQLEKLS